MTKREIEQALRQYGVTRSELGDDVVTECINAVQAGELTIPAPGTRAWLALRDYVNGHFL